MQPLLLKTEEELDPGIELEDLSDDDARVTSLEEPAVASVDGRVGKSGICCGKTATRG